MDDDATAIGNRRQLLAKSSFLATMLLSDTLLLVPQSSSALVKGNAPPSTMKPGGSKPKCSNVEECQALAEQKEQQEREAAEASRVPLEKTKTGVVYRDEQEGSGKAAESNQG